MDSTILGKRRHSDPSMLQANIPDTRCLDAVVIRGLALGTLNDKTRGQFLTREFKMAVALSMILSIAGFCRAIFFKTAFPEALAVTAALCIIVFSSVCLGAILPLLLEWFGVDPAHSSTTIQGMCRSGRDQFVMSVLSPNPLIHLVFS